MITDNPWEAEWVENMRPPKDQTVSEWAAENVYLANSPIGAKFQPGSFCDDVLNDLQNPDVYESAVVGHTGMGKSAILECASCWIVSEAPGPTLVLGQTDKTVQEWMETRLNKAFDKCEPVKKLLPQGKDRHDKKKTSVIFRHMEFLSGAANLSSTQEKSMRYTLGDEPWAWKHGIIGELLKRHHDRWNRKNLLLAQGGTEDDDWHTHTKNGEGFDRGFTCPQCKTAQKFQWQQVKFDKVKDENEEWDWPAIFESVRYECECVACDRVWADTAKDRQDLASRSLFLPRGNSHVPGRVTRYIPAMANPRIQLKTLVQEWLQAETQWERGDRTPRRQFIQKRLAQFWVEKPEVPTLMIDEVLAYSSTDYANGEKWPKEVYRFLTVDVQKDHFWARARAWAADGESIGLYEGKITAWENIKQIQDKYSIDDRFVFIDSRYRPDEVAKWRLKLADVTQRKMWNMVMGEDTTGYRVKSGKRVMLRTFSNMISATTQTGLQYRFFKFSNLRAKDMLAAFLRGDGPYFGIESDHSPQYAKQMQSETKKMFGKDWRWVPIKDHYPNHLWDCYDDQTEVLTENDGFVRFGDLKRTERLATVNLETDKIEYHLPTHYIDKPYRGEMIKIGGGQRQRVDLMVTPDHRMVVQSGTTGAGCCIKKAKDLTIWDKIKIRSGWDGVTDCPFDIDPVLFAGFLGWYIAEGCTHTVMHPRSRNPSYVIQIYQSPNSPWLSDLQKIIDAMPYSFRYATRQFICHDRKLGEYLIGLGNCYTKRVPQWIRNAEPDVIRSFIAGVVGGDGWNYGNHQAHATVSRLLSDDMVELYLKAGFGASVVQRGESTYSIKGRDGNTKKQYHTHRKISKSASLRNSENKPNFSRVQYDGRVYCATVPNGTLIVRRNGKVAICGNCEVMQIVAACVSGCLVGMFDEE